MVRGIDPGGDRDRPPAQRKRGPPGDRASALVLEVVIASIILAGVAVVLVATMESDSGRDRPQSQDLQELTRDTLRILAVTEGNESRRSPLPTLVADALHGRDDELANRTERILPGGASASLHLSNGEAEQTLVAEEPPPNGSVTARQPFAPDWPTLHIVPDLRVYPTDSATDMNVTALPLWGSNPVDRADLGNANVTFPNGFEAPLDADGYVADTVANTTIPNATGSGDGGYPLDDVATIGSNTTHQGTLLEGEATYHTDGADLVNSTHDPIVSNLTDATLTVSPDDVDAGGETTITWDFTPVSSALDDHTDTGTDPEVHVSLYRPIPREHPPLPSHPGALDYPGLALDGSVEVPIDDHAVVGRWLVVAQVNATLHTDSGTVNQSARLVDTLVVRTPGTTGDPRALYGLEMVAWYEGW